MSKQLLTIELHELDQYFIRSVIVNSDETVLDEDILFYYKTLLGFKDTHIQIKRRTIPTEFRLELIQGTANDVPQTFPAYDIQTTEEGCRKYYELIDRICELETMRKDCGIVKKVQTSNVDPNSENDVDEDTARSKSKNKDKDKDKDKTKSKFRKWVEDLLDAYKEASDEKIAEIIDEKTTIAWVLTPILESARNTKGNRILLDSDVGNRWVHRLGTELYPDIVIGYRVTTVDWSLKHPDSNDLALKIVQWYFGAKSTGLSDYPGLSSWIQQAEEDLIQLFKPYRQLGMDRMFAAWTEPTGNTETAAKIHPLIHIIHKMEGEHVVCSHTSSNIFILKESQWNIYLRRIFRELGYGTDTIDIYWPAVNDTIRVWVNGDYGIHTDNGPFIEKWNTIWNKTIGAKNTTEMFELFLATITICDPLESLTISTTEKNNIASQWIQLYIQAELIKDSTCCINSTDLHIRSREWCLQFLPENVMDHTLKPTSLGPIFASYGYKCQRTLKGRMIAGVRFKCDKHVTLKGSRGRKKNVEILREATPISDSVNILSLMMSDKNIISEPEKPSVKERIEDDVYLGII